MPVVEVEQGPGGKIDWRKKQKKPPPKGYGQPDMRRRMARPGTPPPMPGRPQGPRGSMAPPYQQGPMVSAQAPQDPGMTVSQEPAPQPPVLGGVMPKPGQKPAGAANGGPGGRLPGGASRPALTTPAQRGGVQSSAGGATSARPPQEPGSTIGNPKAEDEQGPGPRPQGPGPRPQSPGPRPQGPPSQPQGDGGYQLRGGTLRDRANRRQPIGQQNTMANMAYRGPNPGGFGGSGASLNFGQRPQEAQDQAPPSMRPPMQAQPQPGGNHPLAPGGPDWGRSPGGPGWNTVTAPPTASFTDHKGRLPSMGYQNPAGAWGAAADDARFGGGNLTMVAPDAGTNQVPGGDAPGPHNNWGGVGYSAYQIYQQQQGGGQAPMQDAGGVVNMRPPNNQAPGRQPPPMPGRPQNPWDAGGGGMVAPWQTQPMPVRPQLPSMPDGPWNRPGGWNTMPYTPQPAPRPAPARPGRPAGPIAR